MRLIAVAAMLLAWPPKTVAEFLFLSGLGVWALTLDLAESLKR